MKNNSEKITNLKLQIEIRDKLIGMLLKQIADNKIELADDITVPLNQLYASKIKIIKEVKENEA